MWFRFYYFVFLSYYRKGNKKWKVSEPSYSTTGAFIAVHLSLYCLTIFFTLLLEAFAIFKFDSHTNFYLFAFFFFLFSSIILYCIFIRKGNSEKIYKEFIDSGINTKLNRSICWIIWLICFLSVFVAATIMRQ